MVRVKYYITSATCQGFRHQKSYKLMLDKESRKSHGDWCYGTSASTVDIIATPGWQTVASSEKSTSK